MDPLTSGSSWRSGLPRLEGTRVTLREPVESDAEAVSVILAEAGAARFDAGATIDVAGACDWICRTRESRQRGAAYAFIVEDTASGEIVGLLSVKHLDPTGEGAECDGALTASVRGTGVFGEAAALFHAFAFGTVGTYRLESRIARSNGRANGALIKVGATQEGILRQSLRTPSGQYTDQVLWSVLRDDWSTSSSSDSDARRAD